MVAFLRGERNVSVDSGSPSSCPKSIKAELLKFNLPEKTMWYPSQITELQPDGSAMATMKLSMTVELLGFIPGWGEKVEGMELEEWPEQVT